MSRPRVAIAHFTSLAAAAVAQASLVGSGLASADVVIDGPVPPACLLRVALPAALERQVLATLLASDATRLDVHDVDIKPPAQAME